MELEDNRIGDVIEEYHVEIHGPFSVGQTCLSNMLQISLKGEKAKWFKSITN